MARLIHLYRRIAYLFAAIGGALMLLAVAIVSAEVLSRKVFNVSFGGADEVSGYLFAVATAFSFAHVAAERGNIRVDLLYELTPPGVQRAVDLLAAAAMAAFTVALLWFGYDVWATSLRLGLVSNSAIAAPLAAPQGAWLFGVALFAAVQLTILFVALVMLARGADAAQVVGLRGNRDEAVEEGARQREGVRHDTAGRRA